ncbi:hypothetical protein RJ639_003792 [Escallonia herrerae]|uniref:Association with the SNF1 complex (ASC) domain-containing protein n=1 Tax=Escallonia herrerae TaxID=1293975 RepID=A0AA89AXF4_9ASTE|nr:hypothetical protein RJ639_003792 [Escallonia herrerae]
MGNANGREDPSGRSSIGEAEVRGDFSSNSNPPSSPPDSPGRFRSPLTFAPQVPVAPLQMVNGPSLFNQMWQNESDESVDLPPEQGVPNLITWCYGGNDVAVEGSWDNWSSRKSLKKSGKDHAILLALPSGIYHYKLIVDGEYRYIPDLPFVADDMGTFCNLLDVHVEARDGKIVLWTMLMPKFLKRKQDWWWLVEAVVVVSRESAEKSGALVVMAAVVDLVAGACWWSCSFHPHPSAGSYSHTQLLADKVDVDLLLGYFELNMCFRESIADFFWLDEVAGDIFLLDVLPDYVPENLESVAEFEAPPSPDSSYGQVFAGEEDFAKEPVVVPPHLHLTVLGSENADEASSLSPKPKHVVLNHLFIEKGWAPQSLVALGLTHRFQSKYVTVVVYKPLTR